MRDQILAAVPEEIRNALRHELTGLTERLGERWHGGPWHPQDDKYQEDRGSHAIAQLNKMADRCHADLSAKLTQWSADLKPRRVWLFLLLWLECTGLWDAYLVYRTLGVVEAVVTEITEPSRGELLRDWEPAAWRAAGRAISLLTADANIFRQIVLSNPAELATQARRGVETAAEVVEEIRSLLDDPSAANDPQTANGLRYVELVATESGFFYEFLFAAAQALCDFHGWLATAPRLRTGGRAWLPDWQPGSEELTARDRQKLLRSIDDALGQFRSGREGLSSVTLSRAEPWEQVLSEIREIALGEGRAEDASVVFVPRRLSIRYCYPFAVQAGGHPRDAWLDDAHKAGRIEQHLNERLSTLGIKVQDVKPLDPTAFFAARGSDSGLYGGVHVELPGITLSTGQPGEPPNRCRVWIALSRMGNHCLCVEREPMETPLPHVVYQAVAAGTLYAFGASTSLTDDTSEETTWDNLHSFGRDVIHQAAGADFWRNGQDRDSSGSRRYVRGNLHEVLIVRTDAALATESDGVAAKLSSALGGRILLKSVQSTPTTIDEWVRYPPATGIASLPEIGLAGDWCAYTGETTVFGIVAAPSWHSDVLTEAGQFASSWSPLLRLWSERLHRDIEEGSKAADTGVRAQELREIERTVRRHLAQIQGEELCAAQPQRRFLDRLLEMSGVPRLQDVLQSQLLAAERLTDWWNEDARHNSELDQRKSDQRRDKLLGVIALFGMFELGGFLELANATEWHESFFGLFTLREGIWEDWLVAALFGAASLVLATFYFNFFEPGSWLRRKLSPLRIRVKARRGKGNRASDPKDRAIANGAAQ